MPDSIQFSRLKILARDTTLVDTSGFVLERGEITVLVGASGSGKTLTARSLIGLVHTDPGVVASDLCFNQDGKTLKPYESDYTPKQREKAFHSIRGDIVGYLPQDARASLNPVWNVGRQVERCARLGQRPEPPEYWLEKAGFSDPGRVCGLYAHELSGGMAQRASIALALARGSKFLIADEPTTGLDPTVQAKILDELRQLRTVGVGILLITHDLRIVPQIADHLLVMDGGTVVEKSPTVKPSELQTSAGRKLWTSTQRIAGATPASPTPEAHQ